MHPLQVLSGGQAGRPAPEPVPLPDLLRAASSEIDDYQRVDLGDVDAEVLVTRDAAPGLIMMLAELLDNAARFSPPEGPVVVEGRRVGDQLHLQVRDGGTGLREEGLAEIRLRLANPHRVDHRTAQQMGLSVVGRLAQRLGVGVEFRSQWKTGTRVDITVPAALFTLAPGPVPARTVAPAATPSRSTSGALVPGRTMELPTLATPASASPPSWPPPAPQLPTIPRQRSAEPSPPLVIFEEVCRSPWFTKLSDTAQQPGAAMPAQWQVAAAAAAAARTAPVRTTANGLPMRQAGQRLIPTVATTTQAAPTRRDPDEIRRRVSAFQNGLGHAGRRPHRVLVEESSR